MDMLLEKLKTRWAMGYISIDTMKGWVKLEEVRPGTGITVEEYRQITGVDYDGQTSYNPGTGIEGRVKDLENGVDALLTGRTV